jgi:hypothetical protein
MSDQSEKSYPTDATPAGQCYRAVELVVDVLVVVVLGV